MANLVPLPLLKEGVLGIPSKMTLEIALEMYGKIFKNNDYYTNRLAYVQWYSESLAILKSQNLQFKDLAGCYIKICHLLNSKKDGENIAKSTKN